VTTERLFGRRPEPGDLEDWVRIFTDARVEEELWPAELRSADKVRAMLQASIEHWERWEFGAWTVIERSTERIVGRVGLEHTTKFGHPEVELEWFIDAEAWGRGYATEMAQEAVRAAFTTLGLDTLISCTVPENAASRAVMEKLGMTYEAEVENAGLPHVLYRLSRVT
jgi:ribosomal-protein-alanine N-acetyltransferase